MIVQVREGDCVGGLRGVVRGVLFGVDVSIDNGGYGGDMGRYGLIEVGCIPGFWVGSVRIKSGVWFPPWGG